MAVTAAQFNTVFGTDGAQLTKLGEWADAVAPKVDENGDPVANTLDDLVAHIKADIIAKYDHWKRDVTAVEGL